MTSRIMVSVKVGLIRFVLISKFLLNFRAKVLSSVKSHVVCEFLNVLLFIGVGGLCCLVSFLV